MTDADPKSSIQLDADRYTTDVAASRYVKHPGGVPQPTEHWLVLGPRGAGKTIMLKALYMEWQATPELLPVYIELQPSIAKIAGELPLYGHEPLSPRDRAMLDCMSLAVSVALVTKVAAFLRPSNITDALKLFPFGHPPAGTLEEWTRNAHNKLRETLVSGARFAFEMPPVSVVASALGDAVCREAQKTLVLLVDQVDQVPSPVFQPIVSLLKRTSSYTTIMASRPCPTAPEQAVMPKDVVAGETYQVLSIGRELEIDRRESLITSVLQKLPFLDKSKEELVKQSRTLAALTWPSLRLAIQICQVYEQRLLRGESSAAWHNAIVEVSHRYEDVVKDGLRAWCANPSQVLREWRKEAIKQQVDPRADRIIRATLRLQRKDLFTSVDEDAAEFFRVALKHGILFPGANERYVLDHLPDSFEVAPLLLITDATQLSPDRGEEFVECEVHQTDLKRWVKRSQPREIRTKRIFISYWMSDPQRETSEVAEILRARLLDTVTLVVGEIHGSPQFSPTILNKVRSCNLVICDLTTQNRNIFVEYGWAVGLTKPVIQVAKDREAIKNYSGWLTAKQFQFYETGEHQDKLSHSVIRLLNEPADRADKWIYGPLRSDLMFRPIPSNMVLLGSGPLIGEITSRCGDKIREYAVKLESLAIDERPSVLFEAIEWARKAGTLVLFFAGVSTDYLTCLAGGIFTTREQAYMARRPHRRQLVLFNGSKLPPAEVIPDLLSSYPQVEIPPTMDQLAVNLIARAKAIRDWIAIGAKKKRR